MKQRIEVLARDKALKEGNHQMLASAVTVAAIREGRPEAFRKAPMRAILAELAAYVSPPLPDQIAALQDRLDEIEGIIATMEASLAEADDDESEVEEYEDACAERDAIKASIANLKKETAL